jgi:hypothetical protein
VDTEVPAGPVTVTPPLPLRPTEGGRAISVIVLIAFVASLFAPKVVFAIPLTSFKSPFVASSSGLPAATIASVAAFNTLTTSLFFPGPFVMSSHAFLRNLTISLLGPI